MKAWRVYLKVAYALRTPFVFLLDKTYIPAQREWVRHEAARTTKPYMAELHDCDDFAFEFKVKIGGSCGVVIGSGHAWNMALCTDGVWQVEPQTGEMFKHSPCRAWAVIM
ncbi:MAG: hypothetical protein JRE40_00925 [Deltaproteobacteria bacterium]|nr:hypothetical protein [Deltaproteobacteria bacterium]